MESFSETAWASVLDTGADEDEELDAIGEKKEVCGGLGCEYLMERCGTVMIPRVTC
jgi:hypothetical protein